MTSGRREIDQVAECTADYRRVARRLRARWSHRPRRLHQELRGLAERHDSVRPSPAAATYGPCQEFATEVEARLEGPVLRHDQRRRLLGSAKRLGIGRFEANLVIAAVQHGRTTAPSPATARPRASRHFRLGLVALAAALQGLIVWGAWHVFFA